MLGIVSDPHPDFKCSGGIAACIENAWPKELVPDRNLKIEVKNEVQVKQMVSAKGRVT